MACLQHMQEGCIHPGVGLRPGPEPQAVLWCLVAATQLSTVPWLRSLSSQLQHASL